MRANQVRLGLATMAYIVLRALRQFGLQQTELAPAQCDTIRVKLLKIGAVVRVSVRKVWVGLSGALPFREVFAPVLANLRRLRGLGGNGRGVRGPRGGAGGGGGRSG